MYAVVYVGWFQFSLLCEETPGDAGCFKYFEIIRDEIEWHRVKNSSHFFTHVNLTCLFQYAYAKCTCMLLITLLLLSTRRSIGVFGGSMPATAALLFQILVREKSWRIGTSVA